MTEREEVFRRFLAVQLDDLQPELLRDIGHFRGGTDRRRLPTARSPTRGSAADDRRGSIRLDKSRRAGMKIEPDPVGARLGAGQRVVDAGQTADLHADDGIETRATAFATQATSSGSENRRSSAWRATPRPTAQDTPSLPSDP